MSKTNGNTDGNGAAALGEIRNQVMWTRLIAVVEEQARTLMATAFSSVVREAGDLSAGVFDRRGRMAAQAITGTPGHVNSMALCVGHFFERFPVDDMKPGDHFITNDPWLTSGHLHDVTVVTPVFRGGRAVALFACTCHQVDIGGLGQGPDGRSVYEEGLYIPIMKLADADGINQSLMDIVRGNVRAPLEVEGDILSYMTSNELGGRQLLAMMDEFGIDDIEDLSDFIIDRSHDAMVAAIGNLPKGAYTNELQLDGYKEPVNLVATLTIEDDRIVVDYAGSSAASPYGINVVLNYCTAYTAFGVRCVVAPEIPNNAGSLAPIHVTAPEGSIVNVQRPWPVSARHIIGQFLPDVVLGCLAKALPGQVPAEGAACLWGVQLRGGPEVTARAGPNRQSSDNVEDQRYDLIFFNSGGSGGRPALDGLEATAFPSGVRSTSSELIESLGPVVIWRKELAPDTGGAGQQRGGMGQRIEVGTTNGSAFSIYAMFDRVSNPARGRMGGSNGAAGRLSLQEGGDLPAKGMHVIPGTDRLCIDVPGGAGFGDPHARPVDAVAVDVANGLVSPQAATAEYGVALEDGKIDPAATDTLRRAERP